ncbi:protein kinase [Streptomyces sp. WMMC500]|uniref:protein kinase n=1 Tax=Streptomyces sp. WMMC500 TaxID=3015154 RepID=UPI00248BFA16|nr:protein kinase [Streptomyces sp. WMMC500]WBB63675.1 protein kinase [Streptomyces sp. WMMC500]
MDDYAGRVLADRYRLPAAVDAEPIHTRAFDTYSGQDVLIGQVPLPEIVEAELIEDGGGADPSGYGGGPGRSAAGAVVQRAMDAARAAAAIPDHPRLAQVFDVFEEGGSLWIVSELVPARTLEGLLEERPLSPYRGAEVAADILTALRALHAHGWTHRNITTRTVLVCDDGRVVLTGLASGAAEEALCGYDPLPPPPGRGEPPRPSGSPGPRPGVTPAGPGPEPGPGPGDGPGLPQLPDPATGFLPAQGAPRDAVGRPDSGVLPPGWNAGPGPYGGSGDGADARGGAGPYGTPPYDEDDEVWRSAPYGAGGGGPAGAPDAADAAEDERRGGGAPQGAGPGWGDAGAGPGTGRGRGPDPGRGPGHQDDASEGWPFGAWQRGGPQGGQPGGRGQGGPVHGAAGGAAGGPRGQAPGAPGGGQAPQPYGHGPQAGHSGGGPGGQPGAGSPGGPPGGAGRGGPGYRHPAVPDGGSGPAGQQPRGADPSWPGGQARAGSAPAGGGGRQPGDAVPAARAGVMAAYQAGTRAAEARLAAGGGGAPAPGAPGPGRPMVPGQSARTPEAGRPPTAGGAVPAAGAAGPRYSDRIHIGGDRAGRGGPDPAPRAAGSPDAGAPWDDLPNDAGEDGYDEYGTADPYGTQTAAPGGPYRGPGQAPGGPAQHAGGPVRPGAPGPGGGPAAGGPGSYGAGVPGGPPPHGGAGAPGGPGGPGGPAGGPAGGGPGSYRGPGAAPGGAGAPGGPSGSGRPGGVAHGAPGGPGGGPAGGGPGSYRGPGQAHGGPAQHGGAPGGPGGASGAGSYDPAGARYGGPGGPNPGPGPGGSGAGPAGPHASDRSRPPGAPGSYGAAGGSAHGPRGAGAYPGAGQQGGRGPGAYGGRGSRPPEFAEPEPESRAPSLSDSLPGGASYGGSLPGVRPGASIAVPVGAEPVPVPREESPAPDPGGAGRYPGPSTRLAAERARQTRMQVVGAVTERWAPEQAGPVHEHWQLAPPVGPAADLWALGALLFRAVQGHSAYPEEDVAELVQLVCSEPAALAEECGALRPVVESLLRQDPTERPDFEELRGWLRSLIRTAPEPGIGSRTVTVPQQGGRRGGDPRRLPILRRRGELMRRRRTEKSPVPVRARHRRRARRGPRGPRSLGRTLIALIFVAMAGAIAYAAMFMPQADEASRDQRSVVGDGPGESAAPPPDSGDPNEPEERRQPQESEDAPDRPTDGEQGGGAGSELPDGFVLREDPAGFEVAVREDWQRVGGSDGGQVRYVGGDYELVVVPGRDGVGEFGSDPMAYQQQSEPELDEYRDSAWAEADGLRRIEVGQRVMAEGEFDWTDGSGRQVHARNLAMIWDDSYHVLLLIGPDDKGAEVERFHRIAAESYRPTG